MRGKRCLLVEGYSSHTVPQKLIRESSRLAFDLFHAMPNFAGNVVEKITSNLAKTKGTLTEKLLPFADRGVNVQNNSETFA